MGADHHAQTLPPFCRQARGLCTVPASVGVAGLRCGGQSAGGQSGRGPDPRHGLLEATRPEDLPAALPTSKPVVFALCLLPLAWLVYAAAANQLGANPAGGLIRATGDWTLRALCLVLAVTPLRVVTSTPQLARFRRMLGLFVFFYGLLHLLSYAWFDMGFDG